MGDDYHKNNNIGNNLRGNSNVHVEDALVAVWYRVPDLQ